MSKLQKAQTQQGHSRHFFEYIRSIGESKSKQEEDKIVVKDLAELKKSLSEKNVDKKLTKEYVIRTFYAEMLGQSAEFGHIHCVNLSSNTDLLFKKTGYLATWLCVSPEHELMYLVVSNLQKDMRSNNFLEISASLTAAAKLIRPELMTCINGEVTGLMAHPNALVRKKAVLCMHAFFKKSDGLIQDEKLFRQALCDRDPSVMGASLGLFHDVILQDPTRQRDLLPSLVLILKQITEHRLSRDFDYHRVPAPWLQIKLLKLLALLAHDDKLMTEKCVEVLTEVIKRADTGLNIGHAVVFEAINTITSVYPVAELIELAADAISRFLGNVNSSNLKYLGITALSRIVKIDRKYAQEHQGIVMTCLEDPDDTIRRKTLTLLIAMCSDRNIEAILPRLIKFLANSSDTFLRRELVRNICDLAERFSVGAQWYIETLNKILEIGAEHVTQATIQGMLKLIAEGEGEDEAEDAELRTFCVETYFQLTESPDKVLPPALYQVAAWVLGEYGFLTKKISRVMMMDRLTDLLERVADQVTKGWIVTAMMKIVAHHGSLPDTIEEVVGKLRNSRSIGLQQRCYEFLEIATMPPIMKRVLPLDGCCEEIEVDESLSFLDTIVEDALSKGAKPYEKKEVRLGGPDQDGNLRTEAYKTQRADVVDEDDLDAEKFKTENNEKLIIKESNRRWGAKNLDEEVAVDKAGETIVDAAADEAAGDHTDAAPATAAAHVDPLVMEPRKPTKNEKFLNDIFSDGPAKKKKKGTADRAKESRRRAEEAEAATKALNSENAGQIEVSAPSAAVASSSSSVSQPRPGPSSSSSLSTSAPVKVQTNVQKQLTADVLRLRIGVMADQPLERISIVLAPPPMCSLDAVACPAPGAAVSGNTVTLPRIPANQPAFVEVSVKGEDFPTGGGTTFTVNYHSASGPGSLQGGHPLGFTDLLRAAPLTTQQFGAQWPKLTAGEAKVVMRFGKPITPDALQQHLGERAALKIIQVIGKECIAATRVVPVNCIAYAHMVVEPEGNVNVTVRCTAKGFAEAVARVLQIGQ